MSFTATSPAMPTPKTQGEQLLSSLEMRLSELATIMCRAAAVADRLSGSVPQAVDSYKPADRSSTFGGRFSESLDRAAKINEELAGIVGRLESFV